MTKDEFERRPIRSFVRREGRITRGQKQALDDYWADFGVEPQGTIDFSSLFSRTAPVVMEIGFGMGDSLLQMAEENPDTDYIGVEVHRPGVGCVLSAIHHRGLKNLKVCTLDAKDLLLNHIADASLEKVMVLFPDPWHKKRHNKRRLLNLTTLELLLQKIRACGCLHIATDWEPYAEEINRAFMELSPNAEVQKIVNMVFPNQYRKMTKFEQRGRKLGYEITDFLFYKQ